MNRLLGSSSLSPWGGSRTAAVACTDSHHGWWGLALQKILVDVLGVPLQPSCIQQNIFTALLDSAFCRWSWVTLKEGLFKKQTTIHKGINRHRQDYIFKLPNSLGYIEMLLWITFLVWLQGSTRDLLPPTSQTLKNLQGACRVCKTCNAKHRVRTAKCLHFSAKGKPR